MTKRLSIAGTVLATMAVLDRSHEAAALFQFVSADEEERLARHAERLKRRLDREGESALVAELQRLVTRQSFSFLRDVHPGWIYEYIRGESHRVIGLVCRYLPGDKVRYLIEHLPHKVRDQLPKISESFAIPEELIAQVKRALERRFFCGRRPSPEEPFSLYHIPWMSLRDLEKLISEIGYRELQAGFSKAGPKGLKTFLVRFPIEEAKKIKTRLLIKGTVPPKDRQMAQRHLATVDLTVTEAKKLPYEIGLSVLAQSAAGESADWIDPLVLKLAPAEGYVLRRYLKEVASNHRLSEVARRQEQLLGVVRHLADEGKISRYWQPRRDDETTGSYHVY